jgi:hypothetical protein
MFPDLPPPWTDDDIPYDEPAESLYPRQMSGVEVLREMAAKIEACPVPVDEKAARKKAVLAIVIALYEDSAKWAAVVVAHRDMPSQVEQLLMRVEAATSSAIANGIRKQLRAAPRAGLRVAGNDERIYVRDAVGWEGYPEDIEVPRGWMLTFDRLVRQQQAESGTTAWDLGRPLLVTRRLADIETGDHSIELAWREEGRWKMEVFPRSAAMDSRKLVALADRGLPVSSGSARGYIAWLSALDAQIGTVDRGTARMGWAGKGTAYFLLGSQLFHRGAEPDHRIDLIQGTSGQKQLCGAFRRAGTWEGWQETMDLVADYPSPWLAVYAAVSAPLLRILGAPSWGVDFAGPSSSGKSTCLGLATSTYGSPVSGEGYRSWGGSLAGTESTVATLCDLPLCLDEGQLVPPKMRDQAGALLHAIVDGSGRVRGALGRMGAMITEHWRTVVISTSEDGIVSWAPHDGIRGRILVVRGRPLGDGNRMLAEETSRRYQEHYGHLMPLVVQWLVDQPRAGRDELKAIWSRRSMEIGIDARSPLAGRAARYVATIEGAAYIVHDVLGVPRPRVDVLSWVWLQVQESCGGPDRAARCLEAIWTWIAGHPEDLEGSSAKPRTSWSGVARRDEVLLTPQIVRAICKEEGQLDPTPLIDQWIARNQVRAGAGRREVTARMGGRPAHLIAFVERESQ